MFVDTNQTISITKLQKQLPKVVRDIGTNKSKVFISKRNKISAVILSAKEYERLSEIAKLLEHLEIAEQIEERMKSYNPKNNISWETIKTEYEL